MHPTITSLHTLFTNPLLWLLDLSNRVDMNANFSSHTLAYNAQKSQNRIP